MDEIAGNLMDAGCDAAHITEIGRLYEKGEIALVLRKLRRCRCELMDDLHESQKKVDCLDFLIRKIEKM